MSFRLPGVFRWPRSTVEERPFRAALVPFFDRALPPVVVLDRGVDETVHNG